MTLTGIAEPEELEYEDWVKVGKVALGSLCSGLKARIVAGVGYEAWPEPVSGAAVLVLGENQTGMLHFCCCRC